MDKGSSPAFKARNDAETTAIAAVREFGGRVNPIYALILVFLSILTVLISNSPL